MDIVGTSLSAAQTLLTALQCPQLKDIPEIIGYESQLEELQRTVTKVTAVLRDAERKQNRLPEQIQVQIEELKDAVFDADDLLDEFLTLAEQKRILKVEGHLSEKIRSFFSRSNPLKVALRMSKGVTKIRKKLDAIVYNNQFNFEHDPEPIRKLDRETCSYVNEVDIIGRKDDLDHIVGMLLDHSNVQRDDLSFLSIFGMGGLGKTALAQLVFNDPRVSSAFSLRRWTCVADQDQKQLDVKDIIAKIIGSNKDGSTMEERQSQLRKKLAGNKYLLVLDDVWTEERQQWCELVKYLIGGQKGSWIVVTTRSQKTATVIHGEEYKLQGLSRDDSWRLFEKTAFASKQPNPPDDDLVNIGRKIVDGCAGVPLAIRVAGSLVYGQEKSKWVSVQNNGFAHLRDDDGHTIMPILKLSYHHLASPLKSCFSYCALFPKDCVIDAGKLTYLWIAQGYIDPLDYRCGQSIRDAAEEYFSILLKRCFFQDIMKDEFGDIYACKIHDLMHDIAQSMSRKEIFALNASSANLDNNIKARHLSIEGTRDYGKYLRGKTQIRSHLFVDTYFGGDNQLLVKAVVENLKGVRALDLSRLDLESLPESIDDLLHLRYLDVSNNLKLEKLPKSITKLCNLQTLLLTDCLKLKELPKDMSRLVKLRVLGIEDCISLGYMARGMGKLSSLERLRGDYILGGGAGNNCASWKEWFYGLQDLKTLNNLKGLLGIRIRWPENAGEELDGWSWSWREGSNSCLKGMEHLNSLVLKFTRMKYGVGNVREIDHGESYDGSIMELLMEDLLQPHPNLKELYVEGYKGVKMPGWFTNPTSLPHLVKLDLKDMQELRGVGVEEATTSNPELQQSLLLLPCLSELLIDYCPKLTCLRVMAPKLRHLSILSSKVGCLDSIPMETLNSIQSLGLNADNDMVDLPNSIQYCSSLQELYISWCPKLQSIPNWMPNLTSLQRLKLFRCSKNLEKRCHPPGEDWPYIQHIPQFESLDALPESDSETEGECSETEEDHSETEEEYNEIQGDDTES